MCAICVFEQIAHAPTRNYASCSVTCGSVSVEWRAHLQERAAITDPPEGYPVSKFAAAPLSSLVTSPGSRNQHGRESQRPRDNALREQFLNDLATYIRQAEIATLKSMS
jgi:hypothetical protein